MAQNEISILFLSIQAAKSDLFAPFTIAPAAYCVNQEIGVSLTRFQIFISKSPNLKVENCVKCIHQRNSQRSTLFLGGYECMFMFIMLLFKSLVHQPIDVGINLQLTITSPHSTLLLMSLIFSSQCPNVETSMEETKKQNYATKPFRNNSLQPKINKLILLRKFTHFMCFQ